MSQTSYDVVPYVSQVYPQTHVAHLYMLGRLLNLSPPDFRRARILELGCAAGSNILTMAAAYPEAKCLGIDLCTLEHMRDERGRNEPFECIFYFFVAVLFESRL